jgi:UDP:flavonoid glycosyltransferase YjiC (YdhE family)
VRRYHVAFIVEPAHGHINPILGITLELATRGHRVTCAVNEYFASRIAESRGEAVIYSPLTCKDDFIAKYRAYEGNAPHSFERLWIEYVQQERRTAYAQLECRYGDDKPDLIVYDFRNLAGRDLAVKWGIPKIEHAPILVSNDEDRRYFPDPHDENLVIVSIPRFFQGNSDGLDERFHFVGPSYTNRKFFRPWTPRPGNGKTVLVSGSTGGEPPLEFYRTVMKALAALECHVILSIGDELYPTALGTVPDNCQINQFSSQLEILEKAALFIGQGGPASALEAIYYGVPVLLVPPQSIYDQTARQMQKLGLGIRLEPSAHLAEEIVKAVQLLLTDLPTRRRVEDARQFMRENPGAKLAADLIENYIANGPPRGREPSRAQTAPAAAYTHREG